MLYFILCLNGNKQGNEVDRLPGPGSEKKGQADTVITAEF